MKTEERIKMLRWFQYLDLTMCYILNSVMIFLMLVLNRVEAVFLGLFYIIINSAVGMYLVFFYKKQIKELEE